MAFEPKDTVIYDELWDVVPVAAVVKGQAAVVQDVFGFYLVAAALGVEVCFAYIMRQVEADKRVGTGEDILAGDRLYYIPAEDVVTPTAGTTPGVNSYFCGIAKKDASAAETKVLMNFNGTMYDQTI